LILIREIECAILWICDLDIWSNKKDFVGSDVKRR